MSYLGVQLDHRLAPRGPLSRFQRCQALAALPSAQGEPLCPRPPVLWRKVLSTTLVARLWHKVVFGELCLAIGADWLVCWRSVSSTALCEMWRKVRRKYCKSSWRKVCTSLRHKAGASSGCHVGGEYPGTAQRPSRVRREPHKEPEEAQKRLKHSDRVVLRALGLGGVVLRPGGWL